MKKLLFSFLFVAVMIPSINSQVSLTTAVDFNVTDAHGHNVHLFDLLDEGKYVALEFYTSW
jgi:hypothetical protein